jgi:acyl-CoA thioesterase II
VADLWNDLLACLELSSATGATGPDAGHPVFSGRNQELSYHRLFGGQLLAQVVRAAGLVCPAKTVKSLHVLFPIAGSTAEPVRYEVDLHREGASFAALGVTGRQQAGTVVTAVVSMHAGEHGTNRQAVPPVEPLPGPEHRVGLDLLPWEVRSTTDLDSPAAGPPELELWMRTPPADPQLAPALAAYATDLTLIGTALRPLAGISQRDAGAAVSSAVTAHSVWFHRPLRTDQWLLLRQHSPVLAHGRCFGRGDVLRADGTLLASYAQEALVRIDQDALARAGGAR